MVLKIKKHTGIILIDLRRVFDILDHTILLQKMECIGFLDKTIKWFHSYSTNRTFFVSLDDEFLEAGTINCGVPQGSKLGPLVCYILMIFRKPCQTVTHTCMRTTLVFFINIWTLRESKMF